MAIDLVDSVGHTIGGMAVGDPVAHRAVGTIRRAVGNAVGRRGGMAVGVSGAICSTVHPIGRGMIIAVGGGANAALDATQRRGYTGWFSCWRKQIVVDILDEDSLALHAR